LRLQQQQRQQQEQRHAVCKAARAPTPQPRAAGQRARTIAVAKGRLLTRITKGTSTAMTLGNVREGLSISPASAPRLCHSAPGQRRAEEGPPCLHPAL
jgi:hypothetical protein